MNTTRTMSDDKFMASLLSENSNGPCDQAKALFTCVENKSCNGELSFQGSIIPENNVNGITENGHTQDFGTCIEETNSSDKNESLEDSIEKKRSNDEAKSLSVECSAEEEMGDECNNQIKVEVNGVKGSDDPTEKRKSDNDMKCLDVESTKSKEINEDSNNRTEVDVNVTKGAIDEEVENLVTSLTMASSGMVTDLKADSGNNGPNIQNYRVDLDSSDDDTSSTFSLSSSSDCSDSFFDKMHKSCPDSKPPNIKTKGELDLDELPPIEDLSIDVTEREMQKVGSIYAIVDKLVIVRALKDLQPLDLDSVLFLSCKKPLGRIFDVFGPVVEPFYSIRFNSPEHIAETCVIVDSDVFFAPEKTDITSYVFVDQLRKQKGSDASWQDNNEPPEEYLDYSDDEEEKAAKHKRKAKNRIRRLEDEDVQFIQTIEPHTYKPQSKRQLKNRICHLEDEDVQVIPTIVPHTSKQQDAEKLQQWLDIQKYKQSLSQHPNPVRIATANFVKPSMTSHMTSTYPPKRFASMASQVGMNSTQHFAPQQNVGTFQQASCSPPSVPFSCQPPLMASPIAESSHRYYQSPPPFSPHYIPSRSPLPFHPPPQSPVPIMPPPQSPVLPFGGFQPPRRAIVWQPGVRGSHTFGQVSYFNPVLRSPIRVPPSPPPPNPFAFGPQVGVHNSNFLNQTPNYPSQAPHFLNQTMNVVNQPPNFVRQPSNFPSQNPVMAQAPAGSQWQQGPPSPYGITPLTINIPSTPPPNVIGTPLPSPYTNMLDSRYNMY